MDFNDLLVLAKNQSVSKEEMEAVNNELSGGYNRRPIFARYLTPDEREVFVYVMGKKDNNYEKKILYNYFLTTLPIFVSFFSEHISGIEKGFILVIYDSWLGSLAEKLENCEKCQNNPNSQ